MIVFKTIAILWLLIGSVWCLYVTADERVKEALSNGSTLSIIEGMIICILASPVWLMRGIINGLAKDLDEEDETDDQD